MRSMIHVAPLTDVHRANCLLTLCGIPASTVGIVQRGFALCVLRLTGDSGHVVFAARMFALRFMENMISDSLRGGGGSCYEIMISKCQNVPRTKCTPIQAPARSKLSNAEDVVERYK